MFEKILNYSSADILIFTETRFSPHPDEIYAIEGYKLIRNEISNVNCPYHGTAVYCRLTILNGYPCTRNYHGVKTTILKTVKRPHLMVIGIYRSPKLPLFSLLAAIRTTLEENPSTNVIIIGDLNVNWFDEVERRSLYNLMIDKNALEQYISTCTTDNGTLIDHVYTNMIEGEVLVGTLET